jgi:cysteine desulfurase
MDNRIYLDNAATTPLSKAALDAMMPYLTTQFGNPSAIYSYGREARLAVENARKTVAKILNAQPSEIFFTGGGTESANTAIAGAVRDLGCKHIVTSAIEHHTTLHSAQRLQQTGEAVVRYVRLLPDGHVDLNDLENLLSESEEKTLVALMHANNEIGNLLDIGAAGELCKKYNALFYCDTVQTIGRIPLDLKEIFVHFISASAHKFHGPKGVGMLYINKNISIKPYINGGAQERNMRAGTENVAGIAGFAKALQIAADNREQNSRYIRELKMYMYQRLKNEIPDIGFNGDVEGESLYAILNVSFPKTDKSEMLLYNLDIHHICASGGSACSSGANVVSHVLEAIYPNNRRVAVRFSFSEENTKEEIDIVVEKIKELL